MIFAVGALAVFIAFLSGCEALAVEFHAFGFVAVTGLLEEEWLWSVEGVHRIQI